MRTENNGDIVARLADGLVTSQLLTINADGSLNITDNGGSLTVDGSVTVTASDLDIRDLAFATDKVDASGSEVSLDAATLSALESITVQNGAGAAAVNIQDGGNTITVDGTVELGATTLAALESITVQNPSGAGAVNIQDGGNSITVDGAVTVSASNLDIRDLVFATDKVDVSGSSVTVSASDLDIRDLTHVSDSVKIGDGTDFLAINSDGSINTVVVEDPGTEIVNYNTASAIAAAATSNHDYTAPSAGKLFQVLSTASGKAKIEVQVETAAASGVFNTVAVAFNSAANPNMDLDLRKHVVIPSGARVRVIRTNKDNQSQDLYSTIIAVLN